MQLATHLFGQINLNQMLFIHPMWFCENQRQGMQACTPLGYKLRVLGDLIGLGGLIMLMVIPGLLILRYFRHQTTSADYWLLLLPFIVGLIGKVLFMLGWHLAAQKQFRYDYATRTARWQENGQEKVFPNTPQN